MTVILDRETRDDDAKDLAKSIRCIRHVEEVKIGPVVEPNQYAIESRVTKRIMARFQKMIDEIMGRS